MPAFPHPVRDIWLLLAGSAHPEDAPPATLGGQSYRRDQREWPSLTAYTSALPLAPFPQSPVGCLPQRRSSIGLRQALPAISVPAAARD